MAKLVWPVHLRPRLQCSITKIKVVFSNTIIKTPSQGLTSQFFGCAGNQFLNVFLGIAVIRSVPAASFRVKLIGYHKIAFMNKLVGSKTCLVSGMRFVESGLGHALFIWAFTRVSHPYHGFALLVDVMLPRDPRRRSFLEPCDKMYRQPSPI